MIRVSLCISLIAFSSKMANGQTTPITILSASGNYSENFNSMGTGTTPAYPSGWNGYKISGSGSLANNAFITTSTSPAFTTSDGTGAGLIGSIYNVGIAGTNPVTDRALGSLASVTTIPGFGLLLQNNSGGTINLATLNFQFRAEQWRTGDSNTTTDTLICRYMTGTGIDINFTGGTAASTMDITEILTGSTSIVGVDGNASGNFSNYNVNPLTGNWANGTLLAIRWEDSNVTGTDAVLAIDDFVINGITPVPEPATVLGISAALMAGYRAARRRLRPVTNPIAC